MPLSHSPAERHGHHDRAPRDSFPLTRVLCLRHGNTTPRRASSPEPHLRDIHRELRCHFRRRNRPYLRLSCTISRLPHNLAGPPNPRYRTIRGSSSRWRFLGPRPCGTKPKLRDSPAWFRAHSDTSCRGSLGLVDFRRPLPCDTSSTLPRNSESGQSPSHRTTQRCSLPPHCPDQQPYETTLRPFRSHACPGTRCQGGPARPA